MTSKSLSTLGGVIDRSLTYVTVLQCQLGSAVSSAWELAVTKFLLAMLQIAVCQIFVKLMLDATLTICLGGSL